jgi:hypothetical protein
MNVSPRELMMAATPIVFQGARTWQSNAHHAHSPLHYQAGERCAVKNQRSLSSTQLPNCIRRLPEAAGPGATGFCNATILDLMDRLVPGNMIG